MNEALKQPDERQFREQQSKKIVDFLTRIGAYEYAQKLLADGDSLKESPFEEFQDFLVRINGIARDIPLHERKADGETVYLEGWMDGSLVPRHADKLGLLRQAYGTLDKISADDRAFLLPAVVNAVHLFADGNGRTSRIVHTLLTKFPSKEDFEKTLAEATGNNGRYKTPDINPGFIKTDIEKNVFLRHGIAFKDNEAFKPIFPEVNGYINATENPTTPKAKKFMELRKLDHSYALLSAYEYLKENNLLRDTLFQAGTYVMISPLKMEQKLTDGDWDALFEKYFSFKKEHVEVLIDAFVEPEKYKCLDGSMSLKDEFKKELQRRLEENRS